MGEGEEEVWVDWIAWGVFWFFLEIEIEIGIGIGIGIGAGQGHRGMVIHLIYDPH